MNKIQILVVIVGAVFVLFFMYQFFLKSYNKTNMTGSETPKKEWSGDQKKALEIADAELAKHFPDKKWKMYKIDADGNESLEREVSYEVEDIYGSGSIFTVWYSPQHITDKDIRITVNITDGTVVEYDQHME
jgi:hypothetical protein